MNFARPQRPVAGESAQKLRPCLGLTAADDVCVFIPFSWWINHDLFDADADAGDEEVFSGKTLCLRPIFGWASK